MKHKDNVIAIYTENKYGCFDKMIVDIRNRRYEYISDCRKLRDESDKKLKEFHVGQDFFSDFHRVLENNYSSSYAVDEGDEADKARYRAEEMKKPVVTKEKIWQAINWELEESELHKIISFDYRYEKDNYYDFNLIIEKIHALMNGEKPISYFKGWCVLLMRCFMDNMNCRNAELLKTFYDLGDYFDGVSFMDSTLKGEEKLKECREIIADLKYYNHNICTLKHIADSEFTTDGVITYVSFAFSLNDGEQCLYRICIVDKKRKAINYLLVPDIDYSEGINYTFLSEADFDDLSLEYWQGYALDTSMTAEYALKNEEK